MQDKLKEIQSQGGNGFIGSNGKIYLQRCPKCGLENYALNVPSGICTWCGYNANNAKINTET